MMRVLDVINDLTDKTSSSNEALFEDGPILKVQRFTSGSVTFSANSGLNVMVPITVPEGYKYLTTVMVATNGNIIPGYYMSFNSSTNQVSTWLKNWNTSSSFSCTVSVDVLFIKESLVS